MNYKIGKSSNREIKAAINEATEGLVSPKLIMFFSDVPNFEEYSIQLKNKFNNTIIIGSTTFCALSKDGAFKETLIVLGINEGIECYGGVLEDADKYPIKYVERLSESVQKLGSTENTVCFELCNGLISCEEIVLSTLKSVLSEFNIPVFGGTAGDKGNAEKTLICFDGKVYDNACAFVLIKNLGGRIRLYKENIYKPTEHHFTATKVDLKNRIVKEFDEKPAAEVISKMLDTTIENLPKYLDSYPLGRAVGNDLYITANKSIEPGKAMSYHSRIYKNSQMVLLEPDNYEEVNRNTIEKIKKENPNPTLSIMINCLARSILFESNNYLDTFCRNMGNALGNYVGFGGYGEQLGDQHFNQTMVVAVFE